MNEVKALLKSMPWCVCFSFVETVAMLEGRICRYNRRMSLDVGIGVFS